MTQEMINLSVPLDLLIDSIVALSLENKWRLWKVLNEQIGQAEEDLWEQNPAMQAEIQEARAAYEAGDYVTIDEYIAQRKR